MRPAGKIITSEALEMLRGVKARYEAHHGVTIADEALATAVTLSVAWLPDRRLPDKALDLLDEACARARIPALSRPAGRNLRSITPPAIVPKPAADPALAARGAAR